VSGRRRLRTSGWLASAALLAALSAPTRAAAATDAVVQTEIASNGTVTSELSYVIRTRKSGRFEFDEYTNLRVKITRAGQVLYNEPVGDPCRQFCTPTETALTRHHIASAI
jgi:hypothetical protein